MITTLVSGALIFGVRAAYAEAAKCNYIGIGGVIECSKVTPIPGYSGTFDEGACYDIVLGATTAVTKKPTCDAPPFASGFNTVVCKDGKAYTGKGTPEEVCKANGTELQDQVIKCLDGTTKTLPSNADDAAKKPYRDSTNKIKLTIKISTSSTNMILIAPTQEYRTNFHLGIIVTAFFFTVSNMFDFMDCIRLWCY
jgi:hypothetical protein